MLILSYGCSTPLREYKFYINLPIYCRTGNNSMMTDYMKRNKKKRGTLLEL